MTNRKPYEPGPAEGMQVHKTDGEQWALIIHRTLRHSPETVWEAITDPAQLREWAPFDADANLGTTGQVVQLTTVGAPTPHITETRVTLADAPRRLEFQWGGRDLRWELEPHGEGTRLTLWASIDRRYIAMGAAGWHLCLDIMDRWLDGAPVGRIVGADAMQFDGWQRLLGEYSQQFDVAPPAWTPRPE